ncbi:hypothetical protein PG984_009837 [Apiospora sp. TS-2023a]
MALKSAVDPNTYVDPATNHLGVTVDTRPEHWRRGAYRVSTIRDVLLQHLDNLDNNPSALQQQAINRLANHIRLDTVAGMEDVAIDWFAEMGQITNDLDTIFFRGLVGRDWQTVYYPQPGGITVPGVDTGGTILGRTTWDNPGQRNIEIHLDTRQNGPLRPFRIPQCSRLQRRSRGLGTLCHEMVHAFFMLYGCQSPACCMAQGGDFSLLIGGDGHGPAWADVAKSINAILIKNHPTLEYPDFLAYIYTPGANDQPEKNTIDALNIVEATDPEYAATIKRVRAQREANQALARYQQRMAQQQQQNQQQQNPQP